MNIATLFKAKDNLFYLFINNIIIIMIIHDILHKEVFFFLNRRIGVEANEELRSIFKRDVHLILQVRLKT